MCWKVCSLILNSCKHLKDNDKSQRGDQLLSLNGVSVEGEHHEKAIELLKAAISSVKLVV